MIQTPEQSEHYRASAPVLVSEHAKPLRLMQSEVSDGVRELLNGRAKRHEKERLIALRPQLETSMFDYLYDRACDISDPADETDGRVRLVDAAHSTIAGIYARGALYHSNDSPVEGIINAIEFHPRIHRIARIGGIATIGLGAWGVVHAIDSLPVVKDVAAWGGIFSWSQQFAPHDMLSSMRYRSQYSLRKKLEDHGPQRYHPEDIAPILRSIDEQALEHTTFLFEAVNANNMRDSKRWVKYHKVAHKLIFEKLRLSLLEITSPLHLSNHEEQLQAALVLTAVSVDALYAQLGLNPKPPSIAKLALKKILNRSAS